MIVKFSVERKILVNWVNAIAKSFVFSSGQLHDIFKCIVIRLDKETDNGLQLEVADGVSHVHVKHIPCEREPLAAANDSISFAFYAEMLHKILMASTKDMIRFEYDIEKQVVVIHTEGRYKFPTVMVDAFPLRSTTVCEMHSFSDLNFLDVLDHLTPFAAKEIVRPELTGVSVADDVYVSTVGAYGAIHPRTEDVLKRATLSPYAIKFLKALHAPELADVRFGVAESEFIVEAPLFRYVCRLPAVEFPWDSLDRVLRLRDNYCFQVLVKSGVFQAAIRRVLLLDTDKLIQLGIQFGEQNLRLFCNSQQNSGTAAEELPVEELRLPDKSTGFRSLEIRLSVGAVDSLCRLFEADENPLMITILGDRQPIFVQQRGSKYMFYSQILRPI